MRISDWSSDVCSSDLLAAFDQKHRTLIIVLAVIVLPVNAFFASRIHAGAEFSKSFSERTTVRQDYELINRDFDGANLISIYIDTHVNDALTDPTLIAQLDSLEQWLRSPPARPEGPRVGQEGAVRGKT